jgi:hypothetical protein
MSLASVDKEARRLLRHPRITPRLQALAERREAKALLSLAEHMENETDRALDKFISAESADIR